jgi:ABC-2 type transport system permease protein
MRKTIAYLVDSLYMAWTIASKDIVEALKNKNSRTNIILVMGMVAFFYWASTPRPFDKRIDVILYDEGDAGLSLGTVELADGFKFLFSEASSIQEMKRMMSFKELGLVIPADFERVLESGGEPTLTGYVFWVHRAKAAELETKYADKLTELLGQPVRVEIGENFVIPSPNVQTTDVNVHILFATLWIAITVVPHLMMEEKQAKTMDALLVSPATVGQVVMGKALAGMFYMLLSSGLFFALHWAYVAHWGLALLAFLCCTLFSIGVALALGGIVQSQQQMTLWAIPIVVVFLVPAFFAQEPNLSASLKAILPWFPTSALVRIFQFSLSSSAPRGQLWTNLAIALGSIVLVFALVVWQVRRSDR